MYAPLGWLSVAGSYGEAQTRQRTARPRHPRLESTLLDLIKLETLRQQFLEASALPRSLPDIVIRNGGEFLT
jgi:hypothetical protein